MPRKTRMYIPGVPAHVVQRGNNRDACFFSDEDYRYYKTLLAEGLKRYGAHLHAYCLMTNHVHLLITPDYPDSISKIIQHIGRQYVQHINKTYNRSGTLWEGRHKSSLVDAEQYLLLCYRYIELNPVVANMVDVPEQYSWSSYRRNAWGEIDALVSEHDCFSALGNVKLDKHYQYRELFKVALSEHNVHQIREGLSQNYPLGNERFKAQIETVLNRKIGTGRRGRPRLLVV